MHKGELLNNLWDRRHMAIWNI